MGQVLASDYVELYSLEANNQDPAHNSQIMHQSMLNSMNKSKHGPQVPAIPKPKPSNIRFVNMDAIKRLQIYTSQPITNEFPDLQPEMYAGHQISDGFYYGRLNQTVREGDGVLVLFQKPDARGSVLMQDERQFCFFGTYKDGQAVRQGYAIYANDSASWGDINKNEFCGKCIVKTKENNSYYGQWEDRKLKLGHVLTQQYYYVGSFKDGMRDGLGQCHYYEGTIIKGNWKKDTLEGLAQIEFADKSEFSGHFFEGTKQGFGHLKTHESEFYGEYDNNVKNGFGMVIEQKDDPNNQFQNYTKITESFYVQGIPHGLYCVSGQTQQKEWFHKNEAGEIQKMEHITEKKGLAELYDQNSLENQRNALDKDVKEMIWNIGDQLRNCEQYMVLEKQLDNQTQKLGQLTVYWEWIQSQQP